MYLPDLEMPEKYTWTYDAKREISKICAQFIII